MKFKVSCTWGDGPDVLVGLEDVGEPWQILDRQGVEIAACSFGLTAGAARALAIALVAAADQACELEAGITAAMKGTS